MMNRILKWYLRLVLSRPILRAVDWTAEERASWDLFCRSSCGIKLFEFIRQLVADATFNAVYRSSVSANAHARGMQDLLAVLHRLRVFPNLQEESSLDGLGDSAHPSPEPGRIEAPAERADGWRWLGGRGAIG
jgi:hypothetical protein